ncbi:MAG: hypothetical protein AABZ47_03290, partial [Planctomycetota bacterium]
SWLILPAFLLDVAGRRLASWLALSIAVEAVVLVVLLFGVRMAYGPWWQIVAAIALADAVGWTFRHRYISPLFAFITHPVAALARAGERSETALGELKSVRDRVVRDRGSTAASEMGPDDDQAAIPVERGARPELDEPLPIGGSADLHDALGGARESSPSTPKPGQPGSQASETQGEAATSRLLRAKHRAKKNQDQQGE